MKLKLFNFSYFYQNNKVYCFFVLFYFLNYLITPILFINGIYFSSIRKYIDNNYISIGNTLIILFIVSLSFFYFLFKYFISKRIRLPNFKVYKKTGFIILLILIIFCLISRFYLISKSLSSGGYQIETRAAISRGKGFIELIASSSTVLIPFLFFNFFKFYKKSTTNFMIIIINTFLTLSLLLRGSRSLILEAILPFIFYKFQNNKNDFLKYFFLLSFAGLIGLIFLLFRIGIENFEGNFFVILCTLFMMTFSNYEILLATLSNVEPFQLGIGTTFYESIFYQFIPRLIWQEKPILYGPAKITEEFANWWASGTSAPADFISDAYINFGIFGIIIYSLLLGLIFSYLSLLMKNQNQRIGLNEFIFTSVVFIYTFNLQRVYVGAFYDLILKSAILYFLYNICRRRNLVSN